MLFALHFGLGKSTRFLPDSRQKWASMVRRYHPYSLSGERICPESFPSLLERTFRPECLKDNESFAVLISREKTLSGALTRSARLRWPDSPRDNALLVEVLGAAPREVHLHRGFQNDLADMQLVARSSIRLGISRRAGQLGGLLLPECPCC